MTPPRPFVAKLTAYDAQLRVRWAPRLQVWFIERRLPERHRQLLLERPNPYKSPRGLDLYDGWRAGYVHVLSVPPALLDERVFDDLADADAWRQGGFDALNRTLDAAADAWERATDRTVENWAEDAAKEAHDRLAWLQGRRVAVTEPASVDVIEPHEGFTVRVRKRMETT